MHRAAYEKFGDGDLSHAEVRRRGEGWRTSSRAVTGGPTSVSAVNVPFEIPKGWAWARLGEICEVLDTKRKPITKKDRIPGPYPYYGATCIQDYVAEYIFDEPLVLLGEDGAKWGRGDRSAFCVRGKIWVNNHAHVLRPVEIANHEFLSYTLTILDLAPYITGTTVPKLTQERMSKILLPLPPLAEQRRIVVKIEELFAVVDSLGVAADNLESDAKRLDKKILNLAIRGKLVPQDPSDEPASELVKRIAASHRSPCKNQGKPIDPPFAIPQSWEWVRLGTITNYGQCKSIDAKSILPDTWLLDLEEIEKDTGRLLARRTAAEKKSSSSKHVFCRGMVLYSKLRTYLNKVLVADMDGVSTSEIVPISVVDGVCPEYLCLALTSQYFLQYTASRGYGVKMPRVGTNDMRSALIPLPPLNEQKRIVKRVEDLKATTRTLVTF